jgi:hypothetical protein
MLILTEARNVNIGKVTIVDVLAADRQNLIVRSPSGDNRAITRLSKRVFTRRQTYSLIASIEQRDKLR